MIKNKIKCIFLFVAIVNGCHFDFCEPCLKTPDCLICTGNNNSIKVIDTRNNNTYGICNNYTIHKNEKIYEKTPVTCIHTEQKRTLRRELLEPMERCDLDSIYYLDIGIVITQRLVISQFGGDFHDASVWVHALIAETNTLFQRQLNLVVRAQQIIEISPNTECPDTWNNDCTGFACVGQRLEELTNWTLCLGSSSTPYDDIGSWQIIDDIDGGAGSGVAYVGAVCDTQYKTGSNGFVVDLFRVFGHELGHTLNAIHPLDSEGEIETINAGIMGYGDALIDGEYSFDLDNGVRVCAKLEEQINAECAAFTSVNATDTPTDSPSTLSPTFEPTTTSPTTSTPSSEPITNSPTSEPITPIPTTATPTTTTLSPTTLSPSTLSPTTLSPSTLSPTTLSPTTLSPTTLSPSTLSPTTLSPTTLSPTTLSPTIIRLTTYTEQIKIYALIFFAVLVLVAVLCFIVVFQKINKPSFVYEPTNQYGELELDMS